MTEQTIIVYVRSETGNYGRVRVWTVAIDGESHLREYDGHALAGTLSDGLCFTRGIVHKGSGARAKGNEMITAKRLFEGFQIHSRRYLLDMQTLKARPDPEAPELTGMDGETLSLDPTLNPSARALGSPNWFF